jgi:hypothetical protein
MLTPTQPHGVCFCANDGEMFPYTFVGRCDSAARAVCEQKAMEVVPRAKREHGHVVVVTLSSAETNK